jgi:UDP:flavonoid glycosyltransferase YjiC (YdhE family)
MHITIVAVGSRGDVQPCVAVGLGLREAGYDVRLATHTIFAELVDRCGLGFAPIEGDPRQAMAGRSGQAWQKSGRNALRFLRGIRGLTSRDGFRRSLSDIVEACRGTDAILFTLLGAPAYHVAEMMGVPSLYLLLQPITRSREHPSILAPALPLGSSYNWWTHLISQGVFWRTVAGPINHWRRESLGLPPVPFWGPFDLVYERRTPFIYGFSEIVVPRARDWPEWHHIAGYWFLGGTKSWSPPGDLVDFLTGGQKPIYVGFGSMSGRPARRLADLAIEAVTLAKQRAVMLGGWARAHERELPDHVFAIQSAPHEWLFPRVAAVVHHGGAGTTAAGLRAGVPSVITPFFGDQLYWGRRVYELGVGPQPILRSRLTAGHLAAAITQAVADASMKRRATALGGKIRGEDGVGRAVEIVSRYVG